MDNFHETEELRDQRDQYQHERDTARARVAQLEAALAVAKKYVDIEPIGGGQMYRTCVDCDWEEGWKETHAPDCRWMLAKDALESDGS